MSHPRFAAITDIKKKDLPNFFVLDIYDSVEFKQDMINKNKTDEILKTVALKDEDLVDNPN